ncbi:MAG: hypothetical protein L6R37_005414 [Teloschistes peruensis]|nr:MAG: hypothetical protein L6R37_005414 [Teloschistes peruensis]
MSARNVETSGKAGYRRLPLSHNNADSQASALRLVLTLFPDWEDTDGSVEFIRFKEGITNTLLKAVKKRKGFTEKDIDENSVLRPGETHSHSLLSKHGLAPDLLARFQNGLIYRFIRGQVCDSNDLTQERVWRGVARRIAEWHAILPVNEIIPPAASTEPEGPPSPLAQQSFNTRPSAEAINMITPNKLAPNVWTVIQKWIFALPAESEVERARKKSLQNELERTVTELADIPNLGSDGLVSAHCDLLSGNVIVHPHEAGVSREVETVSFIDYEYTTPAPAAFDLANHFAEWGGFECDYNALPTRSVRRAFIGEYLSCYASHAPLGVDSDHPNYGDRLFNEIDEYRGIPGLYWGIWALIQATISQIDFDYASYAEIRLQEYWDWRAEKEGTRVKEGRDLPLREQRWAEE